MPGKTQITIVGNVGSDPELRYTPTGQAVCNFSVAVTPRFMQNDQWVDGDTTWYRVNAWRTLGENCADTVLKGTRVIVLGYLENREWEDKEGETRRSLEITADAVGPDLLFLSYSANKAERDNKSRPDFVDPEPEPEPAAPVRASRNNQGSSKRQTARR